MNAIDVAFWAFSGVCVVSVVWGVSLRAARPSHQQEREKQNALNLAQREEDLRAMAARSVGAIETLGKQLELANQRVDRLVEALERDRESEVWWRFNRLRERARELAFNAISRAGIGRESRFDLRELVERLRPEAFDEAPDRAAEIREWVIRVLELERMTRGVKRRRLHRDEIWQLEARMP